jgi:hypothetical protein
MNQIKTIASIQFNASAWALVSILWVATINGAWAKEHKSQTPGAQSQVVAHISFAGLSEVGMAIPKQVDEKRYLYVQHGSREGISVVDITEPAKARVVRTIPWPNSQVSHQMNVLGDVAIIREAGAASVPKEDVVLWDLSDPAAPKLLQRFSGVIKVLADDQNFIYVSNAEGLWVISEPEVAPRQDNSSAYGG